MVQRNTLRAETIRVLIAQGMSISQVAKKYGVPYQSVRYHVKRSKIPYVPDSGRNRFVIPNLREQVAAGLTAADIARKYGLDTRRVWWWIRKLKIPYRVDRAGSRNAAWKGGRRQVGHYVYIWCPDHPFATKAKCVLESRLVMELKLGRYLLPEEVVHHKRGYRNNPENLELYESNGAHLAAALKGQIPNWTPEGRRRILEAVRLPRGPRKKPSPDKLRKNASR